MKRTIVSLLAAVLSLGLLLAGCSNVTTTAGSTTQTPSTTTTVPGTTQNGLDPNAVYYADIVIQDHGTITIKLEQNAAPITVANFVKLAQSGFYDGLTFHRIVEDFVMQGGDPEGTGYGGSEEKIYGEFLANGFNNTLPHTRGAISMARSSAYNSASSQFFIVLSERYQSSLDGLYACFGYVTDGMDIVDAICAAAEPVDSNGFITQEEQPVMTSVTIRIEEGE